MDYFGIAGNSDEQLRQMGYVVWMPVQPKGSWLGEGDNPTFMNMLGNGLRAYEEGSYGGWGGRSTGSKKSIDFSMSDTSAGAMAAALNGANNAGRQRSKERPYPNFFPHAQHDFAARLKWSVTPKYAGANHEPNLRIEGPLQVLASAGEKIRLNGTVSDPDGDSVSVKWWQFRGSGDTGDVQILNPDALQTQMLIPDAAVGGQQIHLILAATDNGIPALTRYQRVVVVVRDK